jgi:hypothetical protein
MALKSIAIVASGYDVRWQIARVVVRTIDSDVVSIAAIEAGGRLHNRYIVRKRDTKEYSSFGGTFSEVVIVTFEPQSTARGSAQTIFISLLLCPIAKPALRTLVEEGGVISRQLTYLT